MAALHYIGTPPVSTLPPPSYHCTDPVRRELELAQRVPLWRVVTGPAATWQQNALDRLWLAPRQGHMLHGHERCLVVTAAGQTALASPDNLSR